MYYSKSRILDIALLALIGSLTSIPVSYVGLAAFVPVFAQEDEDGEEDEEHVVHTPEGPSPELEDEGLQVEVIADDLEFPTSMAFPI